MSAIAPAGPSAPSRSPDAIRQERILWAAVAFLAAAAVASATVRFQANPILMAGVVGLVIVAFREYLLAWRTMLAARAAR